MSVSIFFGRCKRRMRGTTDRIAAILAEATHLYVLLQGLDRESDEWWQVAQERQEVLQRLVREEERTHEVVLVGVSSSL